MKNELKLYQSDASPNSRRVRIYLAERSICAAIVPVDLGSKEQLSDAYAAINSRRVVPTLVLADGTAIGEVQAIFRYLDEAYSDRPLGGSTAKEKALIAMWERRMEQEGFAAVMETARNMFASLAGRAIAGPHGYEQIPALVERGKLRVRNFYADLEAQLKDNAFVAGERLSTADITAIATIDFATKAIDLGIPEDHAAVRRWYDAVSARSSMAA